jgi:hypothetical protein
MAERIEMGGTRWGRLLITEFSHVDKNGALHWEFICDCGQTGSVNGKCLRRTTRPTRSCGCLIVAAVKRTHKAWLERVRVSRAMTKAAFKGTKFGRKGQ